MLARDEAKGDQVVPVLVYHAVGAHAGRFGVDGDVFASQLDMIRETGRRTVSISELAAAGDDTANLIAITFDDGFADNLTVAAPLLRDRSMTATVYVTTSYLDGAAAATAPMLSPAGVRELVDSGFEVGSHAVHHAALDRLRPDVVRSEVRASKARLEDLLGSRVDSFAYPHGHRDATARAAVIDAGYRSACIVGNTLAVPARDPFEIARLTIERGHSLTDVASMLRPPVILSRKRLRVAAGSLRRRFRSVAGPL